MKNSSFFILLVCCFVYSLADDYWDSLRITYGDPDDKNKTSFDHMPRHVIEAEYEHWTLIDDQCDSSSSMMFRGRRYWKGNDSATILLFDKNGYIAGIQTSVPEDVKWTPSPTYLGNYILNETNFFENHLTLTAYFVNTSIICTGRTREEFEKEGTGTDLYIQSGPDPMKDYKMIPRSQDDIKDDPLWGHGKCFYKMGQHFWRNVAKTMDCDDFFPFCLMYNKGKLNAFCFAINADVPSDRYEHPDLGEVKDFIEPVPDCMYSDPSFQHTTSLHVYLSERIEDDNC